MENNETTSVLVVDDEAAIRYSVSKTLQRVGYLVTEAASGEEALEIMGRQIFDVVLTDIRMPAGLDGVELVRRIKDVDADTIVVLMTAYPSLATAVEALRLGAHDYLIKPSSSQDIRQCVARGVERARNLKRRRALLDAIRSNVSELSRSDTEGVKMSAFTERGPDERLIAISSGDVESTTNAVMQLGPLTIYPGRYQIAVNDRNIDLTPTEFDLLLYLAAHRGRVVSCHELVREVRGYAVDEAEAREVIRPHVSNLRRKLKQSGQDEDLIVNVRGIGYRLSEQID
ncbi:MAG: response regulator transcription factor [Anaerolineae bacterium]|nr:response regulator transcription factor [Anaerolineae bacterium]MCL4249689.1 response regulator transcription factor [Anaerolineae bacterium]